MVRRRETLSRVSRHETAWRRLCPVPGVGSGVSGTGASLGERRRVGRFDRWASSPCFSFGRPCDLPGLSCELVSVCVVVPLVLPLTVNRVDGGERCRCPDGSAARSAWTFRSEERRVGKE